MSGLISKEDIGCQFVELLLLISIFLCPNSVIIIQQQTSDTEAVEKQENLHAYLTLASYWIRLLQYRKMVG